MRPNYAFWGCTSLSSVVIPENVTTIGTCAFIECKNLATVTIPESVISIGDSAFEVYSNDTYFPIPNLVFTVAKDSYAERWCKENGRKYIIPGMTEADDDSSTDDTVYADRTDWLH